MKKFFKLSIICLVVLFFAVGVQSDDKELFQLDTANLTSIVKPNIVILADSSGSMNTILLHPEYDPIASYSGWLEERGGGDNLDTLADPSYPSTTFPNTVWKTQGTDYDGPIWVARWLYPGNNWGYSYTDSDYIRSMPNPTTLRISTSSVGDLDVGTWVISETGSGYGQVQSKTYATSRLTDVHLTNVVGFFSSGKDVWYNDDEKDNNLTFRAVRLYGCDDREKGPSYIDANTNADLVVRYPRNYLNWVFFHATEDQRNAVSHFSLYQTFDTDEIPEVIKTECNAPGTFDDFEKRLFTRIQVTREVLCNVGRDSRYIGNIGLYRLNYKDGGEMLDQLVDRSEEVSLVQYRKKVFKLVAEDWTPLAEALADIWWYYRPGGTGASKDYWPTDEVHAVATSPVEYYCQMNFVVVMTDGESTYDRFEAVENHPPRGYSGSIFNTYSAQRSADWDGWEDGWGDRDLDKDGNPEPHDPVPNPYDPNDPDAYCPAYSCWLTGSNGSDYLDDVAYFIYNQDMFPDDLYPDWPGDQNIITYTIGFNVNNDLLQDTADNGNGEFYTASDYNELIDAFQKVFLSIKLRSYAFSSITAPVKSSYGSTDDKATVSYIGYFLPDNQKDTNPYGDDPTEDDAPSLWQGHVVAYELEQFYFFDANNDGIWTDPESRTMVTETVDKSAAEEACELGGTRECIRGVNLKNESLWDAGLKLSNRTTPRDLYTSLFADSGDPNDIASAGELKKFNLSNASLLQPYMNADDQTEAEKIITMLSFNRLSDVFHSDVAFVGPPSVAYNFVLSMDEGATAPYREFYEKYRTRQSVLFSGSNDGIFHMFKASGTETEAGKEVWGLFPDEVLPSLKQIALGVDGGLPKHTYTADGRIASGPVFLRNADRWCTLVVFGLREGGNAYYGLDATEDITGVSDPTPKLLWKFKHDTYSGKSWGLPAIGKIADGKRWVVILTGGYQLNNENENDPRGKALFMVDAETGELIWMLGYNKDSAQNIAEDGLMTFSKSGAEWLTKHPYFNFSIPSSLTAYDSDNNGYLDTIYFGNTGGHMFRVDISDREKSKWEVYHLYACHDSYTAVATGSIEAITNTIEFKLSSSVADEFPVGSYVITTNNNNYACGRVVTNNFANDTITVETLEGTFVVGDTIMAKDYEPIFLAPAVATDYCYQPWVTFGTGDRDRPLSNKSTGRYVGIRDVPEERQKSVHDLYGTGGFTVDNDVSRGWFFTFQSAGEKLFDPEPIILPDEYSNPVIFFNTYTPSADNPEPEDDPCDIGEGNMKIYGISFAASCAEEEDEVGIETEEGRIAGGGMFDDSFLMYKGDANVGGVPGDDNTFDSKLFGMNNLAGIVFFLNLQ